MNDNLHPYIYGPFSKVSDMEDPLDVIRHLLLAISHIAEDMGNEGIAINKITVVSLDQCDAIDVLRRELWKLTHPRREHFEKAGWPGG
jgi:hypothetical protein